MKTICETLEEIVSAAISKAFDTKERAEIVPCVEENFGHYQCNSAMKLAKILKINPKEAAEKIAKGIDKGETIEKIEVKGAFINFFLSKAFLSKELDLILNDKYLGANPAEGSAKVIVEFSSPNIAKELHVGHLRSTIIGDSIARLFEFLGYNTLRLNHIGDWGTQFGMMISYLKEKHPEAISQAENVGLTQLTVWYKEAKKLFDSDESFAKRSQMEVVKLQGGDKEALNIWQVICDISRKAFEEIYALLDVKIEERGESFYNEYLPFIVSDLEKKGLVQVSEGAKCIFMDEFKGREDNPFPLMIQKSDGGYNYDTTEITAFWQRCQKEKVQRIIIVTDAGQSLHFKMVYKAALLAGYIDPAKTHFDHVPFGLVLGPDGKKFKTREGETEKLIDLLTGAIDKAKEILKERLKGDGEDLALALGINAVKYADLASHRQRDYLFSYDRMLRFEGNTAAFLMYSYVRVLSIKRKSTKKASQNIALKHPSEVSLGLHLRRFADVLETMKSDLLPNRLADYLYELANKFNAFFRDCQVIGSIEEEERLLLCDLVEKVLRSGLTILGLRLVDHM